MLDAFGETVQRVQKEEVLSSLLSGKYEKGGNYYRHAADTTEQPPFF